MKVVKTLEPVQTMSAEGNSKQRRIAILQRDDRYFTFAEEYYFKSEYEGELISEGWAQLPSEGIFETMELAEEAGQTAFRKRHNVQP
ncbi:hypothetical protein [Bradyrhizobium sp. HKCCYLR20261]|uniref:hypothetical protein n=1 Tax=Bradyrhizobium sp. HKCCYLR20261 TaxID=3420760 RepID=UPI003EBB1844